MGADHADPVNEKGEGRDTEAGAGLVQRMQHVLVEAHGNG